MRSFRVFEDQKGAIICPCDNPASCKWSDTESYNLPCVLFAFPWFGLDGKWFSWRSCFWQNWLLTVTIWPHNFQFYEHIMNLAESYCVFHLASTSVDRCCLYTIIHNGLSWWRWSLGSALWRCRSLPKKIVKAIDYHAFNKYWTKKSHVGPPMREGPSYSELIFISNGRMGLLWPIRCFQMWVVDQLVLMCCQTWKSRPES